MSDEFEKMKEAFDKSENEINKARKIARDVIYKITILCSSVIVFSATLVSTSLINSKINLGVLYHSWIWFLTTIIIGFLILFFEPRFEYAKLWRYFLMYGHIASERKNLSGQEKIKNFFILVYCIIWPHNFVFDKIENDELKKDGNRVRKEFLLNSITRWQRGLSFLLEDLFIVTFIISLIIFINSFNIR